jgi:3',5'-cyclic AMP phosphodiesterase CpdA
MLTLLHISDLHFGPVYLSAVGEALLNVATELSPNIVVASGDFTQRAKAQQFADARAFLGRLPAVPIVVVPGNHDVPLYRVFERLLNPYANYQKYISQKLDTVLARDDAVVVALNTTAPWTKVIEGRITRRQLDFCAQAFEQAPRGAARIVVAHHHFAPAPDYDDEHDVMRRARQALDRFAALGVDLILGGHLHRSYVGNSLDVYPSSDRSSGIVIVHSGTSTSRRGRAREREKNSFNLIQISSDRIHVQQFMYFSDLGAFVPVARHLFPRRESRWLTNHEDAG